MTHPRRAAMALVALPLVVAVVASAVRRHHARRVDTWERNCITVYGEVETMLDRMWTPPDPGTYIRLVVPPEGA